MSSPEHTRTQPADLASVGLIGPVHARTELARMFVAASFSVVGFDLGLEGNRDPIASAEQASAITMAHLTRLGEPDVLVVCTPVALTPAHGADTTMVAASAEAIATGLRRGQLVLLTGPMPPGTTREILLPPLVATGLIPGRDFFLAYSCAALSEVPLVVAGLESSSLRAVVALFEQAAIDVVPVLSLEAAEVRGAVGATSRTVLTALANQLRITCDRMGLEAWEVFGAGEAGLLVPTLDNNDDAPLLLAWGARRWGMSIGLLELAATINAAMPAYVMRQVADALNDTGKPVKGSKVLLLGVVAAKNGEDPCESPSVELMDLLLKKSACVSYNDPHIPSLPQMSRRPQLEPMASQPLTPEYLSAQDCVVIAIDHSAYDYDFIVRHSPLVFDTRNATKAVTTGREKIVKT